MQAREQVLREKTVLSLAQDPFAQYNHLLAPFSDIHRAYLSRNLGFLHVTYTPTFNLENAKLVLAQRRRGRYVLLLVCRGDVVVEGRETACADVHGEFVGCVAGMVEEVVGGRGRGKVVTLESSEDGHGDGDGEVGLRGLVAPHA